METKRKFSAWKKMFLLMVFCVICFATFPVQSALGAEPIVIGAIYDGSGGAAFYSGQSMFGVDAAIDEINKQGGILGRPVKLVKQDDGNNPSVTPIRTRALVEDGAMAIVMTSGSASTLQARVALEELKIPAVCANMNPKIVQPPNNNYIFSIGNNTVQIVQALTEAVKPFQRVAIFTDNGPTGMGLAKSFEGTFKKAGVNVIGIESVDVGATDATALVSRMKAKKVDAVFVSGQAAAEQSLFLRTAQMQGLSIPMFQDITAGNPRYHKLAGRAALKNLQFISQFDPSNPLSGKTIKKVMAKHGRKVVEPSLVLWGWDEVYLIKHAIEKAGSTDGTAIRDALAQTRDFPSTWGQAGFKFNCSMDNHLCSSLKGLVLRGFKKGRPGKVTKRF